MNTIENKKDHYIFSRHIIELYFIRYCDKVGLLIIAMVYIIAILNGDAIENPTGWFLALPLILFIMLLPNLIFRKIAYKITFDLNDQKLTFYLFRRHKSISCNIENLKQIYLGFYIAFVFKEKKFFYNGVADKQLVDLLSNIMPLSWGFWGSKISKYG